VLPLSSPALEKQILSEESFALVVPAGHPLAERASLDIAELAAERFILHRPGQNTRKLIDKYFFRKRITPRVAIELAETEAIKAMVARGLGVSVLPESALLDARAQQPWRAYGIPRKDLKRSLAVVYPRPRLLRPPAVALIELLQKHLRGRSRARGG